MRRLAAITLLLSFTAHAAETELVPLKIAGHAVIAEVAYTESARAQGLKYRKHVRGSHGMLFVYPDAGIP
ncbi:MAG: DUF192 domain-containing protein, partial [Burkholderiales bacterium]